MPARRGEVGTSSVTRSVSVSSEGDEGSASDSKEERNALRLGRVNETDGLQKLDAVRLVLQLLGLDSPHRPY
jgi:hypothetical protein